LSERNESDASHFHFRAKAAGKAAPPETNVSGGAAFSPTLT